MIILIRLTVSIKQHLLLLGGLPPPRPRNYFNPRGAPAPLEPPKIIKFGRRSLVRDGYVKITH